MSGPCSGPKNANLPRIRDECSGAGLIGKGERLTKVAHQGRKKIYDLFFLDGTGIDAKVELPQREPRSYRESLPIEVVLQDGGLSARRPGTATMRSLTQSAFVDEEKDSLYYAGINNGITHRPSATNAGQFVAETALKTSGKSSAAMALDPDNSALRPFSVCKVAALIQWNVKTASRFSECITGGS